MESVLIIGLGNPGSKYEKTRHNAGFYVLDHLADRHALQLDTQKFNGIYDVARLTGKKVLFLKPQTFMNRSGECVRSFIKYFNIDVENILVVHDDLDLLPGRLKMVNGGGAGGQYSP